MTYRGGYSPLLKFKHQYIMTTTNEKQRGKINIKVTRKVWGTFSNIGTPSENHYYPLIFWFYNKDEITPWMGEITVKQCIKALKRENDTYIFSDLAEI
jgi:hypothetical protein